MGGIPTIDSYPVSRGEDSRRRAPIEGKGIRIDSSGEIDSGGFF
jgi:hypothetical protein